MRLAESSEEQRGTIDHLVHAFVPATADVSNHKVPGGNPCLLKILSQPPSESAPAATGLTLCRSWASQAPDESFITVQCFTPGGRAIDCCGHGLLVAGHTWLDRLQRNELFLSMNGSAVKCWHQKGVTWLQFERIRTRRCLPPEWLRTIFPDQPQAVEAASCGDERGYLVVQWPDDFDLKRLSPPDERLSNWSQRAIICTAAQPSTGTDAITLRYFAPQYGVVEDTATGSALRVLADYWSQRFAHITAVQCSPTGGQLLAAITSDHVEIGGRCVTVQTKANND